MLDVCHIFVTRGVCQLTNYCRRLSFKTTIFCVQMNFMNKLKFFKLFLVSFETDLLQVLSGELGC